MDRNTLSRILLAVGVFFVVWSLMGKGGCNGDKGDKSAAGGVAEVFSAMPLPSASAPGASSAAAMAPASSVIPCIIETPQVRVVVSPNGGGISSFVLLEGKYTEGRDKDRQQIDIAYRTSVDDQLRQVPNYNPARLSLRNDAFDDQVTGDIIEFRSEKRGDACVLVHETPGLVRIERTIKPAARPYELELTTTVKNLASVDRRHVFSETLFAYQFQKDEPGMFKRPGPNDNFQAGCSVNDGKLDWKSKGDLTKGGWQRVAGKLDFATISSAYIGQALLPLDEGAHCALVGAEIKSQTGKSDLDGSMLRAALAYDKRTLKPGESATYRQDLFAGPKERHILAAAGGGGRHLDNLIDLGRFAIIAKVLVAFLKFVHERLGSWGLAIILLTVSVRAALFPLTLSQIRGGFIMRKLKPEIDAINAKFADDPQMKMVATSELYKKNGYSPFAGCLPALLQMPVWFALYTSLQTAIELFHEPFAIWADLSSPDPRFVLPAVLGAVMFVQQKVTPMQMDPAQQKVFTYFMPAMFTVFMLFLPAGLGVYMLTNSLLGIAQTIGAERYYASQLKASTVTVKVVEKEKPALPENKRKGDA